MMKQCPQCGSSEIVPDLIVLAQGKNGAQPIYTIMLEPEPSNRPFIWQPQSQQTGFRAAVCGECGHTELYTNYHKELLAAYKKGFIPSNNG